MNFINAVAEKLDVAKKSSKTCIMYNGAMHFWSITAEDNFTKDTDIFWNYGDISEVVLPELNNLTGHHFSQLYEPLVIDGDGLVRNLVLTREGKMVDITISYNVPTDNPLHIIGLERYGEVVFKSSYKDRRSSLEVKDLIFHQDVTKVFNNEVGTRQKNTIIRGIGFVSSLGRPDFKTSYVKFPKFKGSEMIVTINHTVEVEVNFRVNGSNWEVSAG